MKAHPKSIRLFKSDFMERFTHVHPITPLIVWAPVVGYLLYQSYAVQGLSLAMLSAFAALGLVTWTLSEYLLHRFVFHMPVIGPISERFQYIIHGLHHADPQDKTRLVMPPVPAVILAVILYSFFMALLGPTYIDPFFAFFLVGYLIYDYTHYYVHHFNPTTRLGKMIKQNHMLHHYASHGARWGVSSPMWDYAFGTVEESSKKEKTA